MKQLTLAFICGALFMLLTANSPTTSKTVTISQPALPRQTFVKTLEQQSADEWIKARIREGYQIQEMEGVGAYYSSRLITIIMVKY